jgi:hypothetical protein
LLFACGCGHTKIRDVLAAELGQTPDLLASQDVRIVLDGHLSEIVEAHRYLDSIDCLGKTVVLPGVLGARG